jgi:hypothetical protein
MFAGHFAIALAAKRIAPSASLGTLTFAAQWLDLLWPTLLIAGVERVRIDPAPGALPLVFERYPWSHSLAAVAMWALLIAAVHYALRREGRTAAVLAALVASHWVLDAVVHVPDLPILPGGGPLVGAGLWNHKVAALMLELALLAAGAAIYVGTTWARDAVGRWSLAAFVALLAVIQLGNAFGDAPPSVMAIAWVGQAQWLFVLWAAWIDRHRASPSPAQRPAVA